MRLGIRRPAALGRVPSGLSRKPVAETPRQPGRSNGHLSEPVYRPSSRRPDETQNFFVLGRISRRGRGLPCAKGLYFLGKTRVCPRGPGRLGRTYRGRIGCGHDPPFYSAGESRSSTCWEYGSREVRRVSSSLGIQTSTVAPKVGRRTVVEGPATTEAHSDRRAPPLPPAYRNAEGPFSTLRSPRTPPFRFRVPTRGECRKEAAEVRRDQPHFPPRPPRRDCSDARHGRALPPRPSASLGSLRRAPVLGGEAVTARTEGVDRRYASGPVPAGLPPISTRTRALARTSPHRLGARGVGGVGAATERPRARGKGQAFTVTGDTEPLRPLAPDPSLPPPKPVPSQSLDPT